MRAFLRERLGFYAGDIPDQPSDALVVEMSPLERWGWANVCSRRALAAPTWTGR